MTKGLEQQINEFQQWREQISQALNSYRDWLDSTNSSDGLQDLRLFDMAETLRKDRLVLAFVAEFSRGKTETINALFFSDFDQRLLPCSPGRTTMCPTEIFWNPNEEPCIRLLPIETRKYDDGLALLKSEPQRWIKLRLDTSSAPAMKEALDSLSQQKEVSLDEARNLGLWDDNDAGMVQTMQSRGKVDIPVWRHALINFPHPLLKSGLVILDTPGLNALGTEPELTINIIPNAHVVIFLLSTDTGVTKSDMQIWTDYIRNRASRKLALLNKIDILWDDMKTSAEIDAVIQSQVEITAHQLNLPADSVLAISAQKALLAKIKKDDALFQRSGMGKVEQLLAQNVVAAKHEILRNTIITEVANMIKTSRKVIQQRLGSTREQLAEIQSLRGKDRGVVQALLSKIMAARKTYEATVQTFNQGDQKISQMGKILMEQVSLQNLDLMLEQSRQEIGESWTTHGLNLGMKALIRQTSALAEQITRQSQEIMGLAEELYKLFHSKHGFEARKAPALDMTLLLKNMMMLEKLTEAFCKDAINVMTEKHFLVRKFFLSLGSQTRKIFEQAHKDANGWLQSVLGPLKQQIDEHKAELDNRSESLMAVHDNLDSLQHNLTIVEQQVAELEHHAATLDQLLLSLIQAAKTPPSALPVGDIPGAPQPQVAPAAA